MPRLTGAAFNKSVTRDARGRFVKAGNALHAAKSRDALSAAVLGTAAGGPKRQRADRERFAKVGAALSKKAEAQAPKPTAAPARGRFSPDTKRVAFASRPAPAASKAAAVSANDLDTRIRVAYADLATGPGTWVSLARLRPLFGDVPKADLDKALGRLLDAPDVHLEPESNQKTLRDEHRQAAVWIGGEDRHLLAIRPPEPARPRSAAAQKAIAAERLRAEQEERGAGTPTRADATRQKVDAAKADIRAAVLRMERQPGGWVGLLDLRNELGERHNRQVVDRALLELSVSPDGDVNIVPESNQKMLTRADREAAVRIGDQDKHAIMIEPSSERRRATAKPARSAPALQQLRADVDATRLQLVSALQAATSRDAARDALKGLTVAELRALAPDAGITIGRSARKPAIISALVEAFVGRTTTAR